MKSMFLPWTKQAQLFFHASSLCAKLNQLPNSALHCHTGWNKYSHLTQQKTHMHISQSVALFLHTVTALAVQKNMFCVRIKIFRERPRLEARPV